MCTYIHTILLQYCTNFILTNALNVKAKTIDDYLAGVQQSEHNHTSVGSKLSGHSYGERPLQRLH